MPDLKTELATMKASLDAWETGLGLPPLKVEVEEFHRVTHLTLDQLRTLSKTGAAEYACVLASYALFLQRQENRIAGFLGWAQNTKSRFTGSESARLQKLTEEAWSKKNRIAFLSRRVEFMAQCIRGLSQARGDR